MYGQTKQSSAPEPNRVLARYLTLAGQAVGREDINVTITETGPRNTEKTFTTVATCSGCREDKTKYWNTDPWRSLSDVHEEISVSQAADEAESRLRRWAESHAKECRELPVQGVA